MTYRSRSEITALLLEAAIGGGATKTKMMYKAFLSFNQLKEYLAMLVENGLIEYEGVSYYNEGYASIANTKQNRRNGSNQLRH